ncbi:hypothetical protein MNV49_004005 [Pseudohyphozyma bogoriensis]|nr:hypothetical protein MNV49_004005 [Pseudohyphozyma bogoriensis]
MNTFNHDHVLARDSPDVLAYSQELVPQRCDVLTYLIHGPEIDAQTPEFRQNILQVRRLHVFPTLSYSRPELGVFKVEINIEYPPNYFDRQLMAGRFSVTPRELGKGVEVLQRRRVERW